MPGRSVHSGTGTQVSVFFSFIFVFRSNHNHDDLHTHLRKPSALGSRGLVRPHPAHHRCDSRGSTGLYLRAPPLRSPNCRCVVQRIDPSTKQGKSRRMCLRISPLRLGLHTPCYRRGWTAGHRHENPSTSRCYGTRALSEESVRNHMHECLAPSTL